MQDEGNIMLLEQCKKKGASFSEHRAHAQQHSCNGVYDTYVNQNKKRNTNKNYRKKGEKGSIYWFLFDLNRYSKSASYFPFPFLKKKKENRSVLPTIEYVFSWLPPAFSSAFDELLLCVMRLATKL